MACSLDGYIARRDGSVDWLPTGGEEDYGYAQFLSTIDTVIMGRVTYEQLLTFGPFPYSGMRCYVFSRGRTGRDEHVEFVYDGIQPFMSELRSAPGQNIWLVGGAVLAQEFLRAGEVDEFVLTVVPRVLGDGIALFERDGLEAELRLRESRTYPDGLVQMHYDLVGRR
jgi:dihydrofolate reductase